MLSGPGGRSCVCHRGFQQLGPRASLEAPLGLPGSGRLRAGVGGSFVQVQNQLWRVCIRREPLRSSGRRRQRQRRWSGRRPTTERRRLDGRKGRKELPESPIRSTRSTRDRGGGEVTETSSPGERWPRLLPVTPGRQVSLTWSFCPSWSIHSTGPGGTRRWGTSLRPAALEDPKT